MWPENHRGQQFKRTQYIRCDYVLCYEDGAIIYSQSDDWRLLMEVRQWVLSGIPSFVMEVATGEILTDAEPYSRAIPLKDMGLGLAEAKPGLIA